jgi:hypothetical protein
MMNISHCGFFGFAKIEEKNVARMWHMWVSRHLYLDREIKASGHAIVNAVIRVPQISRLLVSRE